MSLQKIITSALPTRRADVAQEQSADADWITVQRVQAGDVDAFNALVERYKGRIYSALYHICANHEDASDLAQETFIRAFRSIQRFRGNSSFYTWLYKIAVNTGLGQIRKNKLKDFFSFDAIDENNPVAKDVLDALADQRSGTERSILAKELQEKINEALHHLPPKHRTAVVLSEIEGLSYEDIAQVMDCSVGTVRSRIHYAKEKLQEALKSYIT